PRNLFHFRTTGAPPDHQVLQLCYPSDNFAGHIRQRADLELSRRGSFKRRSPVAFRGSGPGGQRFDAGRELSLVCSHPPSEVTQLLNAWCKGDQNALERLAPLIEAELGRLARAYLRNEEAPGATLQPADLISEVYLRPIERNTVQWQNRAHFYAVAAKMMRRVLVNHAIARRRQKRGGGAGLGSLTPAGTRAGSADVVARDGY